MTTAVHGTSAAAEFSVVRGQPTPEELAALTAVLSRLLAAREAGPDDAPAARSRWAERSRLLRAPLSPGPGAWRRSATALSR
jgi:hypothetical protein